MARIEVADQQLDRCISIAFSQTRFIRTTTREFIYDRGWNEDLRQTLLCAAIAAWREGYNPDTDFRAIKNLVQRELYRFFRDIGLHRQWNPVQRRQGSGFEFRELPEADLKVVVS